MISVFLNKSAFRALISQIYQHFYELLLSWMFISFLWVQYKFRSYCISYKGINYTRIVFTTKQLLFRSVFLPHCTNCLVKLTQRVILACPYQSRQLRLIQMSVRWLERLSSTSSSSFSVPYPAFTSSNNFAYSSTLTCHVIS